jgi:hypothetical protein
MTGLRMGQVRGIAAALALVAGSGLALADDGLSYNLVTADVKGVVYADTSAHRTPDGFVAFNILTVTPSGKPAYAISQVEINCSSAMVATLSIMDYASNGAATPETVDTTAKPVKPSTLGDALNQSICQGVDLYPRSKMVNGTSAAIAKARDLLTSMQKDN